MKKVIEFKKCDHGCMGGKAHGRYHVDGRELDTAPICSMVMGMHVAAHHPAFLGRQAEEFAEGLKAAGLPDTFFPTPEADVAFIEKAKLVEGGGIRRPQVMGVSQLGDTLLAVIALPGGAIAMVEVEGLDMDSERAVHES